MPEKKMIERIVEVMKDPKRIRNVATSSHVHHGKCVSPDARIALSDGRFIEAEEIFKNYEDIGKIIKNDENEKILDVSHLNLLVPSFNKKQKRIELQRITHMWKLKNKGFLIEVVLENGFRIKVTPEHKFILLDKNCEIIEKSANELKNGESIIMARNLDYNPLSLDELKEIILTELSKDVGYYVFVDNKFGKMLFRKVVENGRRNIWERIHSPLSMLSFYNGAWHCRYRLCDFLQLSKIFGIPIKDAYAHIKFLSYRKGLKRYGSRSSVKIRLPKTKTEWSDMFYLIGLLFGDGSVNITIDNDNEFIHKEVIRICKIVLGTNPTIKRYGKKCPRIYLNGGLTFSRFLEIIFGYPRVDKSHNLRFPKIVERSPKYLVVNFIRGYMDADGTVEQTSVSVSSASRKMLEALSLNLLKFGCSSWIIEKEAKQRGKIFREYVLYISRKSLQKYSYIGFNLPFKQNRLNELLSFIGNNKKFDYIKISHKFLQKIAARNRIVYPHKNKEIGFSLDIIKNILQPEISNDIEVLEKVSLLQAFLNEEICVNRVKEIHLVSGIEYVYDFSVTTNKNFIANGLVIHNTTLTDNLMAGAGMIAEELAGKVMYTWFDEQERRRQLTIYGANVSMVHEYEGKDYLINLVDTPGHVDFGGDVTRAMRAVDGTIVLIDAVESIMPQTETVFRQALRERVKPVLFVNKVDKCIKQLKLTPEELQKKFEEIIRDVNLLIQKYAEEQYKDKWLVSVAAGSVAFGSALKRWAISIPFMQKTGITFKDIIDLTMAEKEDELAKRAPLHQVVLDMIIRHLPNPLEAQKYRLEKIWRGDLNSEVGKDMLNCDPNGKLAIIITKMVPDPHVGFVATGRLFSGKISKGKEVYLVGQRALKRVQQVAVYKGILRIPVDEIPAGNIAAIVGIPEAFTGETVCEPEAIIEPFEEIRHLFEPVVTKSVEAKNPIELPRVVEALKQIGREDTTLQVKINPETGEYLVSGLGELHLEAKVENKLKQMELEVEMSPPIVVYRETVVGKSPEIEGKSPNKHNKLYIFVEPLEEGVYKKMLEGEIPSEMELRPKHIHIFRKISEAGMPYDVAKNIILIHNRNVLIDLTKGVQFMNEIIEMVKDAFVNLMNEGPLAKEPCTRVKVVIVDAELHEDPVHRGPGQIMPAASYAIRQGMLMNITLLEPKQIIRIDVPTELVGEVIREVEGRRGQILDMREEKGASIITAKIPVADLFGFDASLKSSTSGRGFYSLIETTFERLPKELFDAVTKAIRKRKGLPEEIPKAEI